MIIGVDYDQVHRGKCGRSASETRPRAISNRRTRTWTDEGAEQTRDLIRQKRDLPTSLNCGVV